MTRRDRVLQSLRHRDTDIVPYHITFTHEARQRVAAFLGDPEFVQGIGNHVSMTHYAGSLTELPDRPEFFRDDFGVTWNRTGIDKEIGVLEGLVLPAPTLEHYRMPAAPRNALHRGYHDLVHDGSDTFKFGAMSFTMFERAWTLRGMENFLADMLLEPAFAEELLDAICGFDLELLDLALAYDIDGFYFGDDWGRQSGLIMGPRLWRKFIKPRMARLYGRVKSAGKFVAQHSCGDNLEIFPDLIEIGLDVYQTFQPEIYDIGEVKKRFGSDLAFWGGISTQRLLPFASEAEVRSTAIATMEVLGAGGGCIASPTHDITPDIPPRNVAALIDVFRNQ